RYPKVQEKIEKITTPLKALPDRAASQWVRTKNTSFDIIRAAWRFLKTDLPDRIKYTIGQIKAFHAWVKSRIQYFWAKPWLERSLYLGATLFILGFTTLIVLNLGGRWLPGLFDDYTRGFDMVADRVEEFDQKEWQKLDSAFPQPIFTVLLEKIVVNLSRSPGHRNPMGAFKFYVSVDSQETAVEVKDRETEILDYVQRAIEELSYEEVNGYGGRTQIKSLVRAEINRVLNQGRVQDVFIEIMITKP
ncbi:MAG: flagellar basal body-associated FliL family protein, partial [Bdellovibrionales bacterium]|nr:flagellar basal body-associated FliL family protein [Bdellovibrionales bacterium]